MAPTQHPHCVKCKNMKYHKGIHVINLEGPSQNCSNHECYIHESQSCSVLLYPTSRAEWVYNRSILPKWGTGRRRLGLEGWQADMGGSDNRLALWHSVFLPSFWGCRGHGDHVNSGCVSCHPLWMAAGELAGGTSDHDGVFWLHGVQRPLWPLGWQIRPLEGRLALRVIWNFLCGDVTTAFLFLVFIYLAAAGLGWGTQDLWSLLRCVGSLAVVCELLVALYGI